jgi:hypothetical protein
VIAKMRARRRSGNQIGDPVSIALVRDLSGELVGDAETPLRLGEKHHPAVGGDPPTIEGPR